jgi:hypothetical protein
MAWKSSWPLNAQQSTDGVITPNLGGGFCFGADTMYSPALIQLVKELTEGQELKVRLFSLHYGRIDFNYASNMHLKL